MFTFPLKYTRNYPNYELLNYRTRNIQGIICAFLQMVIYYKNKDEESQKKQF